MTPLPVRLALRRTLADVRHVTPVAPRRATGLVAQVYARSEREFGVLAPPLALHSPEPDLLAASWLLLRESLLAEGVAGRAVKELVATAVSQANACPYCVDVHGATLGGFLGGTDRAAVADGDLAGLADPAMRAIAEWARGGGAVTGPAPHPAAEGMLPELTAVAFTFHYLNRMVHVFLDDSPLPAALPQRARRTALSVLGRIMRPARGRPLRPGDALDLLPPADPPPEGPFAGLAPALGQAVARASRVVEDAGRRALPAAVRELVRGELADWDGRPPGIGRGWTGRAVSALPVPERAPARLALLTAMAPYQVDGSVVDEFRRDRPGDAALVAATAWASLAAAQRLTGTAVRVKAVSGTAADDRPGRRAGEGRPVSRASMGGVRGGRPATTRRERGDDA